MKKILICFLVMFGNLWALNEEILISSANAYVITMEDVDIKNKLVEKSKAILIFPSVKKVGFIVGGLLGDGVCLMKNSDSFIPMKAKISNASIGFQVGYENNYMVIFIMDDETLNNILNSKASLSLDATASIYKLSATVGAINAFNKNIYAYTNKSGIFAGASLGGFKISVDTKSIYKTQSYGFKI